MEPPPAFKFPSREPGPLLPLSPGRVNATRPTSTTATTGSRSTKAAGTQSQYPTSASVQSSPSRRANLFADYHPGTTTPTKSTTSGFALPQSPSLPEIHALRSHVGTNSDVQGLVKRFEHLDVRDRDAESVERRRKHEAELGRAQIAREEAESECKKYREESRRLRKERDEGLDRQRRVERRLEAVMDEYQRHKESHGSQSTLYEMELRKLRKEAFKSSSAVFKLQEELKSTRNSLRITQSAFDLTKQKLEHREQLTFEAQYQLVAVQEELDKLKHVMRAMEEERDALKIRLGEEEVARIAAEGMIALPSSQEEDEDWLGSRLKQSARKRAPSPLSDDKENAHVVTKKMVENMRFVEELAVQQMRRERAEEMAEFMRMECTFKCCACRTHTLALELDSLMAEQVEQMRGDIKSVLSPPASTHGEEEMEVDVEAKVARVTVTDEVMPGAEQAGVVKVQQAVSKEIDRSTDEESTARVPLRPSTPTTPAQPQHDTTPFYAQPSIRTITTTTTIPMHFTPVTKPNFQPENSENMPPPIEGAACTRPIFDRAAALAAIEYRRGRAKSIANGHLTPRKQMLEGVNVKERRDISAPALGGKAGGVGLAKGASSVGRAGGRKMG